MKLDVLITLLASLFLASPKMSADSYSITTLPVGANPAAINDELEIVGKTALGQGFLLTNGVFTTYSYLNTSFGSTAFMDINNAGQIVGDFYPNGAVPMDFLFEGGSFSTISIPGSLYATVNGINNSGVIIGSASLSPFSDHQVFLLAGGTFSFVNIYGLFSAINDAGQIVGGTAEGFLLSNGAISDIDFPGSSTGDNSNGDK